MPITCESNIQHHAHGVKKCYTQPSTQNAVVLFTTILLHWKAYISGKRNNSSL